MVAAILSTKLCLLRNEAARRPSQRVVWVLAAVLAVAVVVAAVLLPVDAGLLLAGSVLVGASLVVGWALAPVLLFGAESSVTVDSLRAFPVRRGSMMLGLALASVLSLPGLTSLGVVAGLAAAWWREGPVAVGVALVAGLAGLATAVLAQRIVVDGVALVASSRRAAEVLGGVVLGAVVLAIPVVALIPAELRAGVVGGVSGGADALLALVALTPVGAAWSVAPAVGADDAAGALLAAGIAVAGIAVLAAVWALLVARRMKPVSASSSRRRAGAGSRLGFFGVVPDSVPGAIAARTLTAWLRDPRYSQNLLFAVALPVLGWGLGALTGEYALMVVYVVVSVLLVAASGSLDVSHDSTAFASTIASGVRGRDDRAGRVAAHTLITLPVVAMAAVVVSLQLPPAVAVAVAGAVVAAAGGALGCSAVMSTLVVVPVAKSDEGVNASRSGAGAPTAVLFGAAIGCAVVAALPSIVLTVVAVRTGEAWPGILSLAGAFVVAAAAIAAGIRVGGRLLDRRRTRLYAALLVNA